jgi:hypothetical protein
MPIWQHFLEVLAPRVCPVEENLFTIFMKTQTLHKRTNFSFQTYTKFTICVFLMDFYLIISRRVCPRSFWSNGRSMKHPLWLGFEIICLQFPQFSSRWWGLFGGACLGINTIVNRCGFCGFFCQLWNGLIPSHDEVLPSHESAALLL